MSPRLVAPPAPPAEWTRRVDVVVVGTGAAGLSCALEAARRGRSVLVICKGGPEGGSTPIAQGGLAAVSLDDDSIELHLADTLVAGAGLVEEGAARELVGAAPAAIEQLRSLGARFDEGEPSLEGGHSRPRVVHAGGDASGAEVSRTLWSAVRRARIEVLTDTVALDALVDDDGAVGGLLVGRVLGTRRGLSVGRIESGAVVLATGGFGQAYATTTNQAGATGDGQALALRAGAVLSDVEFVQFHPTVMFEAGAGGQRPLVTEALRGAGATLVDDDGRAVMAGRDPRGDLAPRDVVSAGMLARMHEGVRPLAHLWIDARPVGAKRLAEEFPTLLASCAERGIDPRRELVPVAPGAHYACGGVRADLDGRTSVPGLYAVGEVADTGVHGANRLASNSLTEALIAGRRLGRCLGESAPTARSGARVMADGPGLDPRSRRRWAEAMSDDAGVVRDASGLDRLLDLLDAAPVANGPLDLATIEATNLHTISTLVAVAARAREESRGCHRRSDHPETSAAWAHRLEWRLEAGQLVEGVGALV